jgi:hypothetical protein
MNVAGETLTSDYDTSMKRINDPLGCCRTASPRPDDPSYAGEAVRRVWLFIGTIRNEDIAQNLGKLHNYVGV